MKNLCRIIVTAALGVIAFGTLFAPAAQASCLSLDDKGTWQLKPASGHSDGFVPRPAVFALDASIVGFWRVDFTAEGADTPFDSAYVQWHSDGTEIMNSSRDPRTQSFCLGVWEKTGPFAYTLKHFAMSWDGAGHPVGPPRSSKT